MFKRYDELKKGDKIWFYGYKAFVRDISPCAAKAQGLFFVLIVKYF